MLNPAAVRNMTGPKMRALLESQKLDWADTQHCVTRCAECRWYFRGTVRDGKQAFKAHRELKHTPSPDRRSPRRVNGETSRKEKV